MRVQIDVTVWRGTIPESRHRVQAAAVGVDGTPVLETADAGLVTTLRSAAKPFQLLPLVERGHAERWRLTDEDVAIMCASHIGSAAHVERVRAILARLGLDESALACGYHDPIDPESLAWLRQHPEGRSPVYNNCSGKHAGMLCLALSEGWPVRGYERADHPVQQLMKRTVAEVCAIPADSLGVAVDGCSVSVFALPLTAMARGYAALASARPEGGAREQALDRIRRAMMTNPRLTAGVGRLGTDLMEAVPGRWVAKGGAEGLECIGLVERGIGLAIKAEDGNGRALGPAAVALLEELGTLTEVARTRLEPLARPVLKNASGLDVGAIEAQVKWLASAAK